MHNLPFEQYNEKILVRQKSTTDPSLGCIPEKRPTEEIITYGVVNLDKPKGPTSHQVSAYTQDILKINKAGHSGTLDPGVTGVLPIALGRATRVVQALLPAGKEYVAIMHLHSEIEEDKLFKTVNSFVGDIKQLPPIKSAVKRQLRTRKIYYLDIMEIEEKDVLFRVGCQAGTYIRKLIHDIGKKLNSGAHMAQLRRTKAGPFDESTLCSLQDLIDAFHYYTKENNDKYLRKLIQPVENAVLHLPKVWISDTTIPSLTHGIDLKIPGIAKLHDNIQKDDLIAIMSLKDELVALGTAKKDSKTMMGEKGLAIKTDKVFMKQGLYLQS
tara:strand:- start:4344 stop:5321 length:978 start_codon:yes stop_codon:yes gene_type:complete